MWYHVGNASLTCLQVNPDIIFEVFIHKVDGLSDDHKIGMIILYMDKIGIIVLLL